MRYFFKYLFFLLLLPNVCKASEIQHVLGIPEGAKAILILLGIFVAIFIIYKMSRWRSEE